MIRIAVLLAASLILGAAASYFLRDDSGYVLIHLGSFVLETSVLGLIGALIFAYFAVFYGVRLLRLLFDLPGSVRRVLSRRRMERARDAFELGLIHLIEGRWKRAEVELVRRATDHRAAALNYVFAAQAAQHQQAYARRDHYLSLAAVNSAKDVFGALMAQAQLQVEAGQWAEARATLIKLRAHEPEHPEAFRLLASAYEALEEWPAVLALLQEAEQSKALEAVRDRALKLRALEASVALATELEPLRGLWNGANAGERGEPGMNRAYAASLQRLGADREALAVISGVLQSRWDGALVELAGRLSGVDPVDQLASIEQWLARYGERVELLLTAGRVCQQAQLWGKARGYLETALRVAPQASVYLSLAQLCERTQAAEDAARFYRLGLETAVAAAPLSSE